MDITVHELKEKMDKGEQFVLLDVREPIEREEFNIGGDFIPIGKIPYSMDHFAGKEEEEIVVYCRSGNRSGQVQQYMEQQGFKNVRNLTGGMLAWAEAFGTE